MLDSPETKLFRGYWEDGTLDLVGGAAVVLIGLLYVVEQLVFVGVIVPVALVAWWGIRRQVVEPRAGYVEFSRSRRRRSERELTATVLVGVGALALVAVGAARFVAGSAATLVAGLPALLLAAGAALVGGLTRAWRFGAYAAVFLVAAVVTVALGLDPGWPVAATGLALWGSGAVLFGRFLAASRRFREAGG